MMSSQLSCLDVGSGGHGTCGLATATATRKTTATAARRERRRRRQLRLDAEGDGNGDATRKTTATATRRGRQRRRRRGDLRQDATCRLAATGLPPVRGIADYRQGSPVNQSQSSGSTGGRLDRLPLLPTPRATPMDLDSTQNQREPPINFDELRGNKAQMPQEVIMQPSLATPLPSQATRGVPSHRQQNSRGPLIQALRGVGAPLQQAFQNR